MSAPLLLIDAGNTRVKWATVEGSGPVTPGSDIFSREFTEEFAQQLAERFSERQAVLSTVMPKLVPWFQVAFKGRLHIVTSNSPLGFLFEYPKPEELGSDRLAALAAVHHLGLQPAIIVQCGTATAFSVLNEDGRFSGGVIAPGPHAQLAALVGATAQLPMVELEVADEAIGKSTEQAIRLGVMQSYLGGVKEILRSLCQLGKPPLTSILLTGGNAQFLKDSLEYPHTVRPLLVFEGLRIIGLRAFKDV